MIGAGATMGVFQAKLGLDTKDYAKGILNAQTLNRVFGQSFAGFVANPLLGSIDILKKVGGAFLGAAKQQLAYNEELQRTGQRLGVNTQLLVSLERQLMANGAAGDLAYKGLQKFNGGLFEMARGAGPLRELADSMGLVLDPMAPLESNLRSVLDTISRIPHEAQRSAAAAKIFGEEAGPKIVQAIGGGSDALDQMIHRTRQLGFRVDGTNDSVAGLSGQIGTFKDAIEGIKFNAMQSFLTGLASGSKESGDSIRSTANLINGELGPAMRAFGETAAPIIERLPDAIREAAEYLTLFIEGVRTVNGLWEGSWFQKYGQWKMEMIDKGFVVTIDTVSGTTRDAQIRNNRNHANLHRDATPLEKAYMSGTYMMGY